MQALALKAVRRRRRIEALWQIFWTLVLFDFIRLGCWTLMATVLSGMLFLLLLLVILGLINEAG